MYPILSALFFLFASFNQTASASDRAEAEFFIQSNISRVISVLGDDHASETECVEGVHEIVTPLFDFKLMAKLSLGRKVWPGMTAEQRVRFTELFINQIKTSYFDRIFQFSNQNIRFEDTRVIGSKYHVPTILTTGEKEIIILYKLHHPNDTWKIYDVEVEGVSLLLSFYNQFREILKTATIEDLIMNLEESMNE